MPRIRFKTGYMGFNADRGRRSIFATDEGGRGWSRKPKLNLKTKEGKKRVKLLVQCRLS